MIFVDTSVWIRAFRSRQTSQAMHLTELLDRDEVALSIVVELEILTGISSRNRADVQRSLSALPVFRPRSDTWDNVKMWVEEAAEAGERFGVADLVVAGIATERDAELWSLDSDFERMERLGFVRLHDAGAEAS